MCVSVSYKIQMHFIYSMHVPYKYYYYYYNVVLKQRNISDDTQKIRQNWQCQWHSSINISTTRCWEKYLVIFYLSVNPRTHAPNSQMEFEQFCIANSFRIQFPIFSYAPNMCHITMSCREWGWKFNHELEQGVLYIP